MREDILSCTENSRDTANVATHDIILISTWQYCNKIIEKGTYTISSQMTYIYLYI